MAGKKPRVGLALGAGAARGLAHLGVLQELIKAQIPIDLVTGSSIGSVFGALYACGHDFNRLERFALELKQKHFIDFTVPRMGLIRGNKVEEMFKLLTQNKTFEELNVPLYIVSVDLVTGEKVVFETGSVAKALRASVAIPGIFQPLVMDGKVLVDGAVLDRIPIGVAREKGADLVIAVDVKYGGERRKVQSVNNIFDVILLSLDLLDRELVSHTIVDADIVIRPELSDINPNNFDDAHEGIVRGRKAAREMLDDIVKLIEGYKKK